MPDAIITDADKDGWRWLFATWWWKGCHRLAGIGCWIRGFHLRRDGRYRAYCLQCGLRDERWRMTGKVDAQDAKV